MWWGFREFRYMAKDKIDCVNCILIRIPIMYGFAVPCGMLMADSLCVDS